MKMIYILEFSDYVGDPDNPRGRAKFYMGWCWDARFNTRMREHARGDGACITRAAVEQGITFKVALLIPKGTTALEQRLKRWKSHRRVIESYRRDRDKWWEKICKTEVATVH